jgi:hypothetical protein
MVHCHWFTSSKPDGKPKAVPILAPGPKVRNAVNIPEQSLTRRCAARTDPETEEHLFVAWPVSPRRIGVGYISMTKNFGVIGWICAGACLSCPIRPFIFGSNPEQ